MSSEVRLFEKFDMSIQRGQAQICQLCNAKFSVFSKQHQCKRCLRAVCSNCGTTKRDVYKPNLEKKAHRLCKICAVQSTILIEYIESNSIKFGKTCDFAKKWLQKTYDGVRLQKPSKQQRKLTQQIFNQLWDAYNFSLRQFIGILTFNMNQSDVFKLVNKAYSQLQTRGVDQRFENLIFMVVFLLCYSSPQDCADLVEYLCNLKKSVSDQKQMLQTYLKNLGLSELDCKKNAQYITYKLKQYLGAFSINAVTTQCSIHVITKAFEKQRVDEAYILLAIVLQQNWQTILNNKGKKIDCDYIIIKNCNMGQYIKKFKTLSAVKVSQFTTIRSSLKNAESPQNNSDPLIFPLQKELPAQKKPKLQKSVSLEDQLKKFELESKKSQSVKAEEKKVAQRQFNQNSNEQIGNFTKKPKMTQIFASLADSSFSSPSPQKNNNLNKEKQSKLTESNRQSFDRISSQDDIKDQIVIYNSSKKQSKNFDIPNKNTFESSQKSESNKARSKKLSFEMEAKGRERESPIVHYMKEQCQDCIKKDEKLRQLQEQVKTKRDELESANKELKVSQKQIQILKLEVQQIRQQIHQKQDQKDVSSEQVQRFRQQVVESNEKYNSLMKEVFKYQRENKLLKNDVQELTMNNKILKSKAEQNMLGFSAVNKSSQKQEELTRMNDLLKKNIENKNKQLHEISKKYNALKNELEQVRSQGVSKEGQAQKFRKMEAEKNELLEKMKQLGQRVVKQEEEKLSLSQQLFELKRSNSEIKPMNLKTKQGSESNSTNNSSNEAVQRKSQCTIF